MGSFVTGSSGYGSRQAAKCKNGAVDLECRQRRFRLRVTSGAWRSTPLHQSRRVRRPQSLLALSRPDDAPDGSLEPCYACPLACAGHTPAEKRWNRTTELSIISALPSAY